MENGGDGGIRTLDRALQPYNGLANRRLQPLGHISGKADMPDAGASRKQISGRRIPSGLTNPRPPPPRPHLGKGEYAGGGGEPQADFRPANSERFNDSGGGCEPLK